jgi:hypothetical protein
MFSSQLSLKSLNQFRALFDQIYLALWMPGHFIFLDYPFVHLRVNPSAPYTQERR